MLLKITCAFDEIGMLAYCDFYFYCDFYCDDSDYCNYCNYCNYCDFDFDFDFDFDGYYPENMQFAFTHPRQSQPHKMDANPLVRRCATSSHPFDGLRRS